MLLSEIGATKAQVNALAKKNITTAEALLRVEPLHYYDFTKTYELDRDNAEVAKLLERERPFAIIGRCIKMEMKSNHMLAIKVKEEQSGNLLSVNIFGYDTFRNKFLQESMESPYHKEIYIPDNIPEIYTGEKKRLNASCEKKIHAVNEAEEVQVKDLTYLKTGGRDGLSSCSMAELERMVGYDTIRLLSSYLSEEQTLSAVKWYARGLRIDLAIKKEWLCDAGLLTRILTGQRVIVGGFIKYSDIFGYSVMNPLISDRIDKYQTYYTKYSAVKGISAESYEKLINNALQAVKEEEFLPQRFIQGEHLTSIENASTYRHKPDCYTDVLKAKDRIKAEDLLYFALKMEKRNMDNRKENGVVLSVCNKMTEYIESLPFSLTNDQKDTVHKIYKKAKKGEYINALIQGDVGTGKTAVAFCLLFLAVENGYQGALAAPYTTLALQHYHDLEKTANDLGIHVVFLTSDIKGKKRKEVLKEIADGTADIVIGTHSIFGKDVTYQNLGMIISDEEHKFGVIHRDAFEEKGVEGCHQITMSATPIPKSLAGTIYDASMDIYTILDKPSGRKPIQTAVCKNDITIMKFMKQVIERGQQCYVVCPAIEAGEKNSVEVKSKIYEKYFAPLGIKTGVVTGKLKADEKERIMNDFKEGKIQILIATTVIEVGINVPNATVMAIVGADCFGFSTLHQLRGRVGRGQAQSFCILQTEEKKERLQFLCENNDGFKIAEKDLEMRGPGSLFGESQSGNNYYLSLMLLEEELFLRCRNMARILLQEGKGQKIIDTYEEYYQIKEA